MRLKIMIMIGFAGCAAAGLLVWASQGAHSLTERQTAVADLCAARRTGQAGELASAIDRDRRELEKLIVRLGGKMAGPGAKETCS